jgi:hypothetical protein
MNTTFTPTVEPRDLAASSPMRRHHMAPAYVRGIPSSVWQSALSRRSGHDRTARAVP